MSRWGHRLLFLVAFLFLVTGTVLAETRTWPTSIKETSIKDLGDEKQVLSAGAPLRFFKCGGKSACTVCKAAGACGPIVVIQVPLVGATFVCTGSINPLQWGYDGCTVAANVKHCYFLCNFTGCAQDPANTAACGNYQSLPGVLGCVPNATNTACVPSMCANSGNQGQTCYDCQ